MVQHSQNHKYVDGWWGGNYSPLFANKQQQQPQPTLFTFFHFQAPPPPTPTHTEMPCMEAHIAHKSHHPDFETTIMCFKVITVKFWLMGQGHYQESKSARFTI